MRFFPALVWLASLAPAAQVLLADDLAGPLLGYIADPSGRSVRAIRGLPGSATIGDEIRFDGDFASISVSPSHDAAVLRAASAVRVAALTPGAPPDISPVALPDTAAASLAAFSPAGQNLAVYDIATATLYLVPLKSGRPGNLRTVDLSMVGSPLALIAVSDGEDPLVAGIVAGDRGAAFVASSGGSYRWLANFERPVSLTFLGGLRDLAFADAAARAISRISDPISGAAPETLIAAGLGDGLSIASSPDGRTLLVVDGSRTVRALDVGSGSVASLECECTPSGLQALRGRSVFRLTEALDQPVWLIDAGRSEPRLFFIPAASPGMVGQ